MAKKPKQPKPPKKPKPPKGPKEPKGLVPTFPPRLDVADVILKNSQPTVEMP